MPHPEGCRSQGRKEGGSEMQLYRAEYADEDVMEIILADNDMDALSEAWELEEVHGTLYSLALLDEDYNVIRDVL
jgi:hypothetical protein